MAAAGERYNVPASLLGDAVGHTRRDVTILLTSGLSPASSRAGRWCRLRGGREDVSVNPAA
jgi:hypothetical protein